jgi:ribosomal subunit interface protein
MRVASSSSSSSKYESSNPSHVPLSSNSFSSARNNSSSKNADDFAEKSSFVTSNVSPSPPPPHSSIKNNNNGNDPDQSLDDFASLLVSPNRMQTANVNLPITVTMRHEQVTDSLREHAVKKIEGLHLDYPRIIEAKVILDVQKHRHIAEIILFCANHITIEAQTEGKDMYAALDETIEKIARRMRKHKTR